MAILYIGIMLLGLYVDDNYYGYDRVKYNYKTNYDTIIYNACEVC